MSASAAVALAQFSALPSPSGLLLGRAGFDPNPFVDQQDLDTTGIVVVTDLAHVTPAARSAETARRLALSMMHVAYAEQPLSKYAGPVMASAAWSANTETLHPSTSIRTNSRVNVGNTSSLTLRFVRPSVQPGTLSVVSTPGCTTCCSGGNAVDVQLCTGVEPEALSGCLRATDVTVDPDGVSLTVSFDREALDDNFTVVVASMMPNQQCVVASPDGIPIATSAVLVTPAVVTGLDDHLPNRQARTLRAAQKTGNVTSRDGGFAATPPLGWNAWNAFHCAVSERLLIAMANAMVESGLVGSGFQYINLDDCWMVDRQPDGTTTADPVRFPSGIKALVDYVHAKGLLFGVYQAPAALTPQGRPGLLGHEAQDVATYCSWGVDYIKLDAKGHTRKGWQAVHKAIAKCDHPMFLQVTCD